jgi:hypothetical protein
MCLNMSRLDYVYNHMHGITAQDGPGHCHSHQIPPTYVAQVVDKGAHGEDVDLVEVRCLVLIAPVDLSLKGEMLQVCLDASLDSEVVGGQDLLDLVIHVFDGLHTKWHVACMPHLRYKVLTHVNEELMAKLWGGQCPWTRDCEGPRKSD